MVLGFKHLRTIGSRKRSFTAHPTNTNSWTSFVYLSFCWRSIFASSWFQWTRLVFGKGEYGRNFIVVCKEIVRFSLLQAFDFTSLHYNPVELPHWWSQSFCKFPFMIRTMNLIVSTNCKISILVKYMWMLFEARRVDGKSFWIDENNIYPKISNLS